MSLDLANIRLLRAVTKTLRREADHTRGFIANREGKVEPAHADRLLVAATVADVFADALNEAAEELAEAARIAAEAIERKAGDIEFNPRGKAPKDSGV